MSASGIVVTAMMDGSVWPTFVVPGELARLLRAKEDGQGTVDRLSFCQLSGASCHATACDATACDAIAFQRPVIIRDSRRGCR